MTELRPYQTDAIERVRAHLRAGVAAPRRVLLVLPTGAGKTITAVSICLAALAKGRRVLWVAHRLELIDQAVRAFARAGITRLGVVRADDPRRDDDAPLQVGSIQTLARREQRDVDLIIIDEAHRAVADSYTRHLYERHASATIIGLTATPCRADGRPLGTHFAALVVGATYSDLISSGALVTPLVYSTPTPPDLSGVRTTAGDYHLADLESAMLRGALVGDIVTQWMRHPRQRTVAFSVSIRHSRTIVESFLAAGVRAEHLDGETPEDERRAILARLSHGETELVSNVGVLTEGWDCPPVKTLILARPTKSLALYMQMAGRILRPWEGVQPIVLDHGGNVDRHGLPQEDREWSLSARVQRRKGVAPAKTCGECHAYVPPAARTCPHCGADLGVADPLESGPLPVDLELRTLDDTDPDARLFRQAYLDCRRKGWHYGAACHRYENLYRKPPKPEWVDAAKRAYRRDRAWRTAVAARRAARAEQAA